MKKTHLSLCILALITALIATPQVAAEGVTLTLLSHYTSGHPHGQALQQYIAEYEALNPGIEIEHVFTTVDEFLDRLMVSAAADSAPDIMHIAGYMLGELAEAGIIAPLPPHVLGEITPAYLPGALDLATYRGKLWGYPTEFMPRALVYNQVLFNLSGLSSEPPKTWEDLSTYAAKLTRAGSDGTIHVAGFGVPLARSGQHPFGTLFSLARPLGGRFLSDDGRHAAFNSPAVDETLEFLYDLVSRGRAIAADWIVLDMRASELAMTVAPGPYWKTEFQSEGESFYAGIKTALIPVPQAELDPAAASYGWLYAVSSKAANPSEAYRFLTWLNTKELEDGRTRMGNILAHLGSLPVTVADFETQDTVRDPFMQGFVEAASRGYTFADPTASNTPQMYRIIDTMLRNVVQGVEPPASALVKAEHEVQVLLDETFRDR